MSLIYYSELAESKGVVLCRGDVLARPTAGEALTCGEARRLMALVLAYYTRPECYRHVHAMNHSPHTFLFDQMAQQALALETVATTTTPH
jgi:hypothetical protein